MAPMTAATHATPMMITTASMTSTIAARPMPTPHAKASRMTNDLTFHLNGTSGDDGYYRLTANINISADTTWTPIANFRGTFNGDNHTIAFHAEQPNPPLFDTINISATVTHIGIINSILAHANHGNISYAYATGDSYDSIHRIGAYIRNIDGGLVGLNSGTITNCLRHRGHSYSNDSSGGLVGDNRGRITHSYATGNSTCTWSILRQRRADRRQPRPHHQLLCHRKQHMPWSLLQQRRTDRL